jgi:hypothetical protein
MTTNDKNRFMDVARMDKVVFLELLDFLKVYGGLCDSKYMCCGEKLMIFIEILKGNETSIITNNNKVICLSVGTSYRQVAERWQHSTSTISDVMKVVSSAILTANKSKTFLPIPTVGQGISNRILESDKYYSFFENCIGALDGCHIPAYVPMSEQKAFRNRKGFLSQNMLAVVDFNMIFMFVHVGCEGSAHDGRVL